MPFSLRLLYMKKWYYRLMVRHRDSSWTSSKRSPNSRTIALVLPIPWWGWNGVNQWSAVGAWGNFPSPPVGENCFPNNSTNFCPNDKLWILCASTVSPLLNRTIVHQFQFNGHCHGGADMVLSCDGPHWNLEVRSNLYSSPNISATSMPNDSKPKTQNPAGTSFLWFIKFERP